MSSLLSLKSLKIPANWCLIPIGKVLLDSQYGTNAPTVPSGSTSIVGMKDIQDGKVLTDSLTKTDLPESEKLKYLLKKGDLLINRTNSYDLVGKVGIFCSNEEVVFASYLVRLITDRDRIIPEYLNYWLNSYNAQVTIKKIATRAVSQANINPTEFKKYCFVPLPSLPEQTAIADLLSIWDTAIEKIEKLIAAKEKLFSWLSYNLLGGESRLHDFQKKWLKVKFQEIFEPFKKVNKCNVDCEVLSVTKSGIVSQAEYFNKDVASEDKSKYLIVERGMLVMSGLNFWMGSIDFQNIRDTGIVSPAYKTFKIKNDQYNKDYLRFFVRSSFMTRILIGASVQGASIVRRNLDSSMLNDSTIHMPPLEEQERIANILVTAEKEISLLERQVKKFHKQKCGLMQKLLAGLWRVKISQETC